MEFPEEVLFQAAKNAWKALMGLSVREKGSAASGNGNGGAVTFLAARIRFSGAVDGVLILCCDESMLRTVTAGFYGLDLASLPEGLVRDLLGEVVNVIGGQIKSHLPAPSVLNLPEVSRLAPAERPWEENHVLQRVRLEYDHHPMELTLSMVGA